MPVVVVLVKMAVRGDAATASAAAAAAAAARTPPLELQQLRLGTSCSLQAREDGKEMWSRISYTQCSVMGESKTGSSSETSWPPHLQER